MRGMKSRTEVSEVLIVELSSIVGDNGVRQSEPEDDGLLDEVFHLPLTPRGSASTHLVK